MPWRQEPCANGEGWPLSALARVGLDRPDPGYLSKVDFTAMAAGMGSREVDLWMDFVMGPDLRVLLEPESTIEAQAEAGRRVALRAQHVQDAILQAESVPCVIDLQADDDRANDVDDKDDDEQEQRARAPASIAPCNARPQPKNQAQGGIRSEPVKGHLAAAAK